ncbi:MAG: hypothetical protein RI919_1242 [Actinomycetota bacterium]
MRTILGFLDGFEKGLERIVTGAFSKTFKSELQPIEISSAIKGEMDAKASIVARDRILAPNTFTVYLSSADFKRMQELGEALLIELNDQATRHATRQKFQFGAALMINIVEDGSLNMGQVRITSATAKVEVEWTPTLEVAGQRYVISASRTVAGQRYVISASRTVVGRDASADIQVADNGLSRKHFEILWDGAKAGVRDLQSTNGTKVNGRPVTEVGIATDTVIEAGKSTFVFRVIAKSVSNE